MSALLQSRPIEIELSRAINEDLTITFNVTGTARNNSDFTIVNDTVTIPAGQTSGNLDVTILDDGLAAEVDETIVITLDNITGSEEVVVGETVTHTITVTPNPNDQVLIFVANSGDRISVFSQDGNGNIAPLRTIEGDATGLANPSGVFTANNELFVIANGTSSINAYDQNAVDDAAPKRTIQGAATTLNVPQKLFITNGEIFVANNGNDNILVFAQDATGNVALLRTITSSDMLRPFDVSVVNNELFVANDSAVFIEVFEQNADGNVLSKRKIGGGNTQQFSARSLFVVDNEIYVTNGSNTIRVFAQDANGNVPPLLSIISDNTTLSAFNGAAFSLPFGIFAFNNEIYAVDREFPGPSCNVFLQDATGDIAPVRDIVGAATTFDNPQTVYLNVELASNASGNLFSMQAQHGIRGVEVTWQNAQHTDASGFHIWRRQNQGKFKRITPLQIMASRAMAIILLSTSTPMKITAIPISCGMNQCKGKNVFLALFH